MRRTWALLLAGTLAFGSLAIACGDDDDASPKPVTEAGSETGSNEGGTDGGDGGTCTFASYVINLVNTQTNAAAQPDKGLGAGCKESTTQAEFKPLFP